MNTNLRGGRYSPSPKILHEYARQRLYVTLVKGDLVLTSGVYQPDSFYYVECNKFGHVDWQTARVFSDISKLVIRDNVFFIES